MATYPKTHGLVHTVGRNGIPEIRYRTITDSAIKCWHISPLSIVSLIRSCQVTRALPPFLLFSWTSVVSESFLKTCRAFLARQAPIDSEDFIVNPLSYRAYTHSLHINRFDRITSRLN